MINKFEKVAILVFLAVSIYLVLFGVKLQYIGFHNMDSAQNYETIIHAYGGNVSDWCDKTNYNTCLPIDESYILGVGQVDFSFDVFGIGCLFLGASFVLIIRWIFEEPKGYYR